MIDWCCAWASAPAEWQVPRATPGQAFLRLCSRAQVAATPAAPRQRAQPPPRAANMELTELLEWLRLLLLGRAGSVGGLGSKEGNAAHSALHHCPLHRTSPDVYSANSPQGDGKQ